jgi:valyl-tRNA synthetase
VHRVPWPDTAELRTLSGTTTQPDSDQSVLVIAADVLRQIRKAKSDAKRSVRAEATSVTVMDTRPSIAAVRAALGDLRSAGNVRELITVELPDGAEATVDVQLPEAECIAP